MRTLRILGIPGGHARGKPDRCVAFFRARAVRCDGADGTNSQEPTMGFLQDWTTAKKTFETKTKEKKPSEKFMGYFRKSSGLESACKALDASLKQKDYAAMKKAEATFRQASKSYSGLLMQTNTSDKGTEYKAQLRDLEQTLYDIAEEFVNKRDEVLRTFAKQMDQILEKYEKTVRGALQGVLKMVEAAESQYQVCDTYLRDLVMAVANNRTAGIKKAGGALTAGVKDMAKLVDQIKKISVAWDKKVSADLREYQKNNKELVAVNSQRFNIRDGEIRTYSNAMTVRAGMAEDRLEEAKELLVTANKAIKDGVNTKEVFARSIAKFAERARTLHDQWDHEASNFDTAVERPQEEYDKILEETLAKSKERAERFKAVKNKVIEQVKEIETVRKGMKNAHLALLKEWSRFPKDVRENSEFEEDSQIVEEVFLGLGDTSVKKLDKAERKLLQLLKKVN
jgi:hypothetical protein